MFREYTKMLNYKKENWNIVNRKIKLALVGLGRVAQTHLEAIEKLSEHLDLVAVCDKNEDKLQKVTQRFNSKSYYNISDCLENTDADVVVLCTPSGLHSKQTILAAEHGKHIITEKPMATRWKDGIKMLEACEENNVRLFVVKQNRFNEPLQLLKKAIQENFDTHIADLENDQTQFKYSIDEMKTVKVLKEVLSERYEKNRFNPFGESSFSLDDLDAMFR